MHEIACCVPGPACTSAGHRYRNHQCHRGAEHWDGCNRPTTSSTAHLALPFEIPQLQLPAPKLSSEHGAGPEYSPLSSIGANPQHHAGAPVPQPFDVSYLTGYVSDVSSYRYGIYYEVVREFKDLRSNHPEVMQKT